MQHCFSACIHAYIWGGGSLVCIYIIAYINNKRSSLAHHSITLHETLHDGARHVHIQQ